MSSGRRDPADLERRLGPRLDALYRLAWRLEGDGAEERLLDHLADRNRREALATATDPAEWLARQLVAEAGACFPSASEPPSPLYLSRVPGHTAVLAALDGLASGEALYLRLLHGDGYPPEELSRLFDENESTIRSRLAAARDHLRAGLAAWPMAGAPISCRPVRERLDGWLAGDLDADAADAVGEHLSHCADCRAVTAAEQGLRRQLTRQPVPPPSPAFQERARAALNPPSRMDWLRLHGEQGWRRFTVPVLVAAVLAGLFILWVAGQSASRSLPSSAPSPVITEEGRFLSPGGMNRDRSRDRQRRTPPDTEGDQGATVPERVRGTQ